MSASTSTPPTPIREGGPEYASRSAGTTRQLVTRLLVGCVLVAGPTACNNNDIRVQPPPTATPSTSPSPVVDEQAALLAQYEAFWSALTDISRMPATARSDALGKLSVDPALKSLLNGMRTADSKSQVFYGAAIPRASAQIDAEGTTALVDDCQDASRSGLADKKTGRQITKGVVRNHVTVTMKRSPDGAWRVAFIAHPTTPC